MWIKTEHGSIINSDHVARIFTYGYEVRAVLDYVIIYDDGSSENAIAIISSHQSHPAAERKLNSIFKQLKENNNV